MQIIGKILVGAISIALAILAFKVIAGIFKLLVIGIIAVALFSWIWRGLNK